jgi:hypothetical protein
MKNNFRQTNIGYCVVYAWASALNDKLILKFINDERFKGCTDKEESEILEEFLPNCGMHNVAYVNVNYPGIPKNFIWDIINNPIEPSSEYMSNPIIIYMLSVRKIKTIWHQTVVLRHNSGVYYLDPYFAYWMKLKGIDDIETLFIDCCQIQRPYIKNTDQWALINADNLNYEFLTNNQNNHEQ